jgi:hypothetical protein
MSGGYWTRLCVAVVVAALTVLVHLPAPIAAQTTGKDVSQKTVEAWDTVKAYSIEKKNEAVVYGKKLVREADARIRELENKAETASGETKAKLDKEIASLKAKRDTASKKLDEMGKATGAAWDSAKNGFAEAYKDLAEAYKKGAAQFK